MCCDLIELLACGHDGKTLGWEICTFQNLMQAERRKGTPENAQIMIEYESICGKCPEERRIATEEICNYCRLYESSERGTDEDGRLRTPEM